MAAESVSILPPFRLFNGSNTPVGEDVGTPRLSNEYVSAESPGMSFSRNTGIEVQSYFQKSCELENV